MIANNKDLESEHHQNGLKSSSIGTNRTNNNKRTTTSNNETNASKREEDINSNRNGTYTKSMRPMTRTIVTKTETPRRANKNRSIPASDTTKTTGSCDPEVTSENF